ncbi:acyl-CoA-binding domain-containing protein 4 isoform X1 [Salmo salar]|uniref:Acyl-CoA-binding domain-containing protein 5 n=1 Tax=Salmo salar TaxID=8030 RepID=A0A1S3NFC2_SALSA|nr:acyl-CoA-binding domain-containing protein 4 isoform X1 [Salmo salar]XP_014014149.1 acyl-CoA-binding domain-containing protein 4 isoform X1 [Salmo salar]|eukprot:XP_014014148.1 PREDICTED: acyl-CoA-binding domain-containing protein 5-like [Salmo salar]
MPQGCAFIERRQFAMPVPVMAESVDHQKRFQAAVDVIQNLPKSGAYRPPYEVMLRFYCLYKQAVCGPCTVSRPGFWDPVGRYKWDAWSRLGEMSSEIAMAAYVDEMKKVAQEVIDTMPINEKTASLFHHFEPLYVVIHDMPRPPDTLLDLRDEIKGIDKAASPVGVEQERETQEEPVPDKDPALDEEPSLEQVPVPGEEPITEVPTLEEVALAEKVPVPEEVPSQTQQQPVTFTSEPQGPNVQGFLFPEPVPELVPSEAMGSSEVLLTSDSESEIFVDSVDSVEKLDNIKVVPKSKSNGLHNGHAYSEPSSVQANHTETVCQATQVGAGQGGEGAGDGGGPPMRRSRDAGREGMRDHGWRERGVPQGSPRRAGREALGAGGGAGRGGGDGSEGGAQRLQDIQVQQQILLALRRLREDMRSVMERLEAVERLAAAQAQNSDWRPCLQCAASAAQSEESWWPFPEVSGRTMLLLLLWPLMAQGIVFLLRKGQKKARIST